MTASSPMPSMLTDQLRQSLRNAQDQVNALVLGKVHEVRLAFVALLSGGHLLIEDLPVSARPHWPMPWPAAWG